MMTHMGAEVSAAAMQCMKPAKAVNPLSHMPPRAMMEVLMELGDSHAAACLEVMDPVKSAAMLNLVEQKARLEMFHNVSSGVAGKMMGKMMPKDALKTLMGLEADTATATLEAMDTAEGACVLQ
eukprot:438655-Pyramimonas_sp.AAC.1